MRNAPPDSRPGAFKLDILGLLCYTASDDRASGLGCRPANGNRFLQTVVMDMYLGIDVGGTFTKLCVADSELRILKSWKQPTEKTGDIVDFLEGLIRQSKQEFPDISCVGMGLPGTVDAKSGIVQDRKSVV